MGAYGNQFAQPPALAKFRRTHSTLVVHIKSATEALHAAKLAKTTIIWGHAATAAYYLAKSGKTAVLPVLTPMSPLYISKALERLLGWI